MKIDTPARAISTGGIFTALACILQSSPVWLPGAGLFLSPFATLPAALAAIMSIPLGVVVYLASAFLLMVISPQEAAIFLLATGLLGLFLGIGHRKEMLHRILISGTALFIGLLFLTHLALIPVFGGMTPRSLWAEFLVYLPFSLLYAALWAYIMRFAVSRLGKTRLFQRPPG